MVGEGFVPECVLIKHKLMANYSNATFVIRKYINQLVNKITQKAINFSVAKSVKQIGEINFFLERNILIGKVGLEYIVKHSQKIQPIDFVEYVNLPTQEY